MTQAQTFAADLANMNAAIDAAGAVMTEPDGFRWVNEAHIPVSLASAYRTLVSYGYANGMI